MKHKFTARWLDELKATGKDYVISDAEHKGLAIKVSAAGAKTFVFPHRSPKTRKVVTLKLGRYPTLSLAKARIAWTEARRALDEKRDPVPFFVGTVDAAPVNEKLQTTFGAMLALYHDECLVSLRRGYHRRDVLARFGARYGFTDRIANEITPTEAWAALLHMKGAYGPATALQAKSVLRTFYKWGRQPQAGYVTMNPFSDLGAPAPRSKPRDRVLSTNELVRVWKALDDLPAYGIGIEPHYAIALKLVFLTGARPGMISGMERGELVNLDAPQPKIRKVDLEDVESIDTRNFEIVGPALDVPGRRMKNGERFICPLSPLAIALIKSLPSTGKFVIARPGTVPIETKRRTDWMTRKLGNLTRALYPALGIERFTPHDFRQTAATMLGTIGWDERKIGLLLAHESKSVTGRHYDHSQAMKLKRAMVMLLEKIIRDNVEPAPTGDVVAFKRAAA